MAQHTELAGMTRAFGLALSVHVLMALLVWLGTKDWKPFRQPQPVGMLIEAVMVDTSQIREQREAAAKAAADAEQRKQAEERRARELEQQREREKQAELQRQKQAEEQRKQELEAQRKQALEQQRQKELEEARRKKEAQEKLQQLRMENERRLEEERLKQQQELEKIRKQREEADRQQKLEAERLKQLEARKTEEAAEQRRKLEEAERLRQVEAEKRAAEERAFQAGQEATKTDSYRAAIQALVTQNWLRPPTAQAGLRCKLRINQIPGGEVISAAIARPCNADETTQRSIVAAVERVGALPYRGYEDVFTREIEFTFIYDGD